MASSIIIPVGSPTIYKEELGLLQRLHGSDRFFLREVKRNSARVFDLKVMGRSQARGEFSAWLPMWAIRSLVKWTSREVAAASDYPEMVADGDWSGIRDSSHETIWLIFEDHVARPARLAGVAMAGAGRR